MPFLNGMNDVKPSKNNTLEDHDIGIGICDN